MPVSQQKNKLHNFLDKTWRAIVAIILILGGIASWIAIENDWLKKDQKKMDETTINEGDLKSQAIILSPTYKSSATTSEGHPIFLSRIPPVFEDNSKEEFPKIKGIHITDLSVNKPIWFEMGNQMMTIPPEYFYQGVDLLKTFGYDCTNTQVIMGLKNNRLYISTEFKRLANKETMGIIEFNHWKLYRKNAMDYQDNDTMLEVRDWENKIAFSIKYGQIDAADNNTGNAMNGVLIRGYFLGDTSIVVVNNSQNLKFKPTMNCISRSEPNWEQKASLLISEIKSLWKNGKPLVPTGM